VTVIGNVTLSNGQVLTELRDENGVTSYRLMGCTTGTDVPAATATTATTTDTAKASKQ
jgi:hypothetical protein